MFGLVRTLASDDLSNENVAAFSANIDLFLSILVFQWFKSFFAPVISKSQLRMVFYFFIIITLDSLF